jgi:pyruvate/2-oxoglutarate dehydrogenase complex dihydrolipoamide acyltransferase (E2) component
MSRDTGQKRRDNAATKTPKRRDNAATHWLSVAEVARLEGIAPRTVQRRCTAGKYTFRTLETANGPRFEINADSLKNSATTEADNAATIAATTPRQNEIFAATNAATRRDNSDQNAATMETELRDQLAREREQSQFLRGVIEQLQRDGAEVRAALREALKHRAPQLTQGNAPEPQKPAERKGATDWSSIYGQIADELEAQEQNR